MHLTEIDAPADGPALTLRLQDAYQPASIVGNVWRYRPEGGAWKPDGKVGVLTPLLAIVPIGGPRTVAGSLYLVIGAVTGQPGKTPSPYQVVVSILQGDTVLHHEVPSEGGSGMLGAESQPFVYRFVIRARS